MRLKLTGLVIAGVAALVLGICSVAVAARGLTGTYQAKIKSPAQIKGTWGLTLKPNGAYVVSMNGKSVASGRWSATATTITFREPEGCGGTGTYAWKRTNAVLRFTFKREDPRCQIRRAVLTHPFAQVR